MKSRNILITIILFITIILISVGIYLSSNVKEKEKPAKQQQESPIPEYEYLDENQKYVIDNIVSLNQYITDSTKTSKDFGKLTGNSANYYSPIVGPDAVENIGIIDIFETQVKDKLTEYSLAHKKLSKNLEKAIKETYKYELVELPLYTEDKSQLMQQIKVTPFDYGLYQRDMQTVQEYLLGLINKKELKETAEDEIYRYKSRIKAMEILDSQIAKYKSQTSYETNIVYNVKDKKDCYSCMFYMNYAKGEYSSEIVQNGKLVYENKQQSRLNTIINEATTKAVFNKEKPLELASK